MKTNEQLENNFTHHPPKSQETVDKYSVLREKHKELAYAITNLVPDSREKSLALTNLEQSMMWSNAGIARNEK